MIANHIDKNELMRITDGIGKAMNGQDGELLGLAMSLNLAAFVLSIGGSREAALAGLDAIQKDAITNIDLLLASRASGNYRN